MHKHAIGHHQTPSGAPAPSYPDVTALLRAERPVEPVYGIYPEVCRRTAREFVGQFPGRTLYAVKSNDEPVILKLLYQGGVRHFDCASLPEIQRVQLACPTARCYFMVPTRLRGAARQAFEQCGVRHFMVDHASGIDLLADELDLSEVVVFVRMAVHHQAALQNLSAKFGAPPELVPGLLQAVAHRGAEPALAFNVGSSVIHPQAYEYAIGVACQVLRKLPFRVRLVDIGGGFPHRYPGFDVPPLSDYFAAIAQAARELPLADGGGIMAEPGRALSAPGVSAVVEVLLRKEQRLYLNDGMYGVFWELRFKEHESFAVRAFRHGQPCHGPTASFSLYGPTCDATDVMPGEVQLPQDIRAGDYLEFGSIGAYSLAGRTRFNSFYSDRLVEFSDPAAQPPGGSAG